MIHILSSSFIWIMSHWILWLFFLCLLDKGKKAVRKLWRDYSTLKQYRNHHWNWGACVLFHTFVQSKSTDQCCFKSLHLQKVTGPSFCPENCNHCMFAGKILLFPIRGKVICTNSWVLLLSLGSLFPPVSIQALLWEKMKFFLEIIPREFFL